MFFARILRRERRVFYFPWRITLALEGSQTSLRRECAEARAIIFSFPFHTPSRFIIPPPLRDSPCLRGRKWVLSPLCPSKLGGRGATLRRGYALTVLRFPFSPFRFYSPLRPLRSLREVCLRAVMSFFARRLRRERRVFYFL